MNKSKDIIVLTGVEQLGVAIARRIKLHQYNFMMQFIGTGLCAYGTLHYQNIKQKKK